jgi:hypothetical protein
MLCFGIKGKLAPRYIESFKVEKRIVLIEYKVALPLQLAKIHNVFHVSLLQKTKVDNSQALPQVPLEVKKDLTLKVKLIGVLDRTGKDPTNNNKKSYEKYYGEAPK